MDNDGQGRAMMEILGYIGLCASAAVVGLAVYKEWKLFKEWQEQKRIQTKSKLRILSGGVIGGRR